MALKDFFGTYPAAGRIENKTYVFPNSDVKYNTAGGVEKPIDIPVVQQTPPVKEPVFTGATTPPAFDNSKYINPETGKVWSDQEYADMIVNKARGNSANIGTYAGNAVTNPNASVSDLTNTGRNLNNAANDIATGATDPYGVASKSGIQYTPQELKAIEHAYAGVFDPALNDVFTRLDAKKKADDLAQKSTDDLALEKAKIETYKQQQIFSTNENIRQWRETTGKTAGTADNFSDTQKNKGAMNSGMTIDEFNQLDPDIKNFYINTPKKLDPNTNKNIPLYQVFEDAFAKVKAGTMAPEDLTQQITDSNTLPDAVKHYFIDKMPLAPEKKQGYLSKLWGAITGE